MKVSLPGKNFSYLKLMFMVISIPCVLITGLMLLIQADSAVYKVTHEIYFDIETGSGSKMGLMVFGLFGQDMPKTVQNFYTFATSGFMGLKYEGSIFHRVIPNFMIQGGDVIYKNGSGQISIYGKTFEDENFKVHHSGPGYLSMANRGKDSNGCQFFVTTTSANWLNGHHVAFGKVLRDKGMDVLDKIEFVRTDSEDKPLEDIVIKKSGSREVNQPYWISDDPYNFEDWAKTISKPITIAIGVAFFFYAFIRKMDSSIAVCDELEKRHEETIEKQHRDTKKQHKKLMDRDKIKRTLEEDT